MWSSYFIVPFSRFSWRKKAYDCLSSKCFRPRVWLMLSKQTHRNNCMFAACLEVNRHEIWTTLLSSHMNLLICCNHCQRPWSVFLSLLRIGWQGCRTGLSQLWNWGYGMCCPTRPGWPFYSQGWRDKLRHFSSTESFVSWTSFFFSSVGTCVLIQFWTNLLSVYHAFKD